MNAGLARVLVISLATAASGLACTALLGVRDVPTPSDAATGAVGEASTDGGSGSSSGSGSTSGSGASSSGSSTSSGGSSSGSGSGSGSGASSSGTSSSGSGSGGDAGCTQPDPSNPGQNTDCSGGRFSGPCVASTVCVQYLDGGTQCEPGGGCGQCFETMTCSCFTAMGLVPSGCSCVNASTSTNANSVAIVNCP